MDLKIFTAEPVLTYQNADLCSRYPKIRGYGTGVSPSVDYRYEKPNGKRERSDPLKEY
jgi:hypothetical protein